MAAHLLLVTTQVQPAFQLCLPEIPLSACACRSRRTRSGFPSNYLVTVTVTEEEVAVL